MPKLHKKKAAPFFDPIKAKRYAERVKALMVERKALNEDISAVCDEAKDDGLEPTFIRFAAQESLKDEADRTERDEKRAMYLGALGLAVQAVQSGEMSARQAAKLYKIGKTSVYKELSVREVSAETPSSDADGVITETPAERSVGEVFGTAESRAAQPDDLAKNSTTGDAQGDESAPINLRVPEADRRADEADGEASRGGGDLRHGARRDPSGRPRQDVRDPGAPLQCDVGERGSDAPAGRNAAPVTTEPEVARVVPPATDPDTDDLAIPDFLRGSLTRMNV